MFPLGIPTNHRCKICGMAFCVACTEKWGTSENRTRCGNHINDKITEDGMEVGAGGSEDDLDMRVVENAVMVEERVIESSEKENEKEENEFIASLPLFEPNYIKVSMMLETLKVKDEQEKQDDTTTCKNERNPIGLDLLDYRAKKAMANMSFIQIDNLQQQVKKDIKELFQSANVRQRTKPGPKPKPKPIQLDAEKENQNTSTSANPTTGDTTTPSAAELANVSFALLPLLCQPCSNVSTPDALSESSQSITQQYNIPSTSKPSSSRPSLAPSAKLQITKTCYFVDCSSNSLNHDTFIRIPTIPKPVPSNASNKIKGSYNMKRKQREDALVRCGLHKDDKRKDLRFCSLHSDILNQNALSASRDSQSVKKAIRNCCFDGCNSNSLNHRNFTRIQAILKPLPEDASHKRKVTYDIKVKRREVQLVRCGLNKDDNRKDLRYCSLHNCDDERDGITKVKTKDQKVDVTLNNLPSTNGFDKASHHSQPRRQSSGNGSDRVLLRELEGNEDNQKKIVKIVKAACNSLNLESKKNNMRVN